MQFVSLPEMFKIVEAITPQAGDAITGDYVSLKNFQKAFVIVEVAQAAVNQMTISIEQATNVSAGGSKAITNAVPIWANEDCAASDTFVRQTDAVSFQLSAAQKHKIVVFQIDPSTLDVANGFDCIVVKTGASDATNITSAQYILVGQRYGGGLAAPSAITD